MRSSNPPLQEFLEVVGLECNTLNYTLVVFSMFRVFCRYNLNFS